MGLLKAEDSQFRLGDDGVISYQAQVSNPLPGESVARLVKGAAILAPQLSLLDVGLVKALDQAALQARLDLWLCAHLKVVLEPLVALKDDEALSGAVKDVASRVYDAMGIVPREALAGLISELEIEARRDLRARKIFLGPVLVFMPALNKPAAVHLRALLWGLFHGKDLPVAVPKDGIVSFEVDLKVDRNFYQAIGYPVYGTRAVRIDMLDRVISAVYDGAEKGKFRAEHKMAEWLGSSIEGLYTVLEAMGHRRIVEVEPVEVDVIEGDKVVEGAEAVQAEEKTEDVKPVLAQFHLKKGKAFQSSVGASSGSSAKSSSKKTSAKKPQKLEKSYKGKRNKTTNRTPKVMSAEVPSKPEDSPFAILAQLKKPSDA